MFSKKKVNLLHFPHLLPKKAIYKLIFNPADLAEKKHKDWFLSLSDTLSYTSNTTRMIELHSAHRLVIS